MALMQTSLPAGDRDNGIMMTFPFLLSGEPTSYPPVCFR